MLIELPLKVTYCERLNPTGTDRTIILLHGYGETKERMMRKVAEPLVAHARRWISLSAPFPCPQLTPKGPKPGYAWYFRSLKHQVTMIPPQDCQKVFQRFVAQVQLNSSPVVIIGFSQGGYIMPYLASEIRNISALIGISCGLHVDQESRWKGLYLDLIHSAGDELSNIDEAESQFQQMQPRLKGGAFHRLSGAHGIDAEKIAVVEKLLKGESHALHR